MTEPPAGPEGMDEDDPHAEGAAVVAAAGEALQAPCQELNLDEGRGARPKPWTTSLPSGATTAEREKLYTGWHVCCMLLAAKV